MTRSRNRTALLALAFLASATLYAQEQWTWPEKPKNLQVLPKDFTGQRLRPVMTGFTRALGVRCSYCHIGEEGKPLSSYDFASDQNPNKERAREMLRMLGSINEHLKKITPSSEPRVNMWCHTCHQGRPRPATLEEELSWSYRKGGIDAATARYRELRGRYYGKAAYDFSERSLNTFGHDLLEKGDHTAAITVFAINAAEFPLSGNVWDSLAETYLAAGKKELAEIYYRKSLEIDPQNENALTQLRKLQTKSPG